MMVQLAATEDKVLSGEVAVRLCGSVDCTGRLADERACSYDLRSTRHAAQYNKAPV